MDPQRSMVPAGAPDRSTVGPPIYANVAHISFTPYDFTITFSQLAPTHGDPAFLINEAPTAVAEIVVPAASVESLVDLLRAQLDSFVDEFGAPRPSLAQAGSRT